MIDVFLRHKKILNESIIEIIWLIVFAWLLYSDTVTNLHAIIIYIGGSIILSVITYYHTERVLNKGE